MSVWTRLGLAVLVLAWTGAWICRGIILWHITHSTRDQSDEARQATRYIIRTGVALFLLGIVALLELAVLFVGGWL
jgi:hypothetical protein